MARMVKRAKKDASLATRKGALGPEYHGHDALVLGGVDAVGRRPTVLLRRNRLPQMRSRCAYRARQLPDGSPPQGTNRCVCRGSRS